MKSLCKESMQLARAHQMRLTKPPGSLGQLEEIVIRLAGCQGKARPEIRLPWISVFAADHGVTAEGVSAFPSVVTQQMVRNFSAGGAAVTVLADLNGARLEVVDVGVFEDVAPLPKLVSDRVSAGSRNFRRCEAMTAAELEQAMQVGERAVQRALQAGADLFIAGEMGIGNTTSATALISRLCAVPVAEIVGYGTGIDDRQKAHKTEVIEASLLLHEAQMNQAESVLRCVGGLEIAAMTGAYLACAKLGIAALVDGVIASAAAMAACDMAPGTDVWLLFGHRSAEPAQQAVLKRLNATPILDLEMRLGEGSGAAAALPIVRQACALHANMATFEDAGVAGAH